MDEEFFNYLKVTLEEDAIFLDGPFLPSATIRDGIFMDGPLLPSTTIRDGVFARPRYINLVDLTLEDVGKVVLVKLSSILYNLVK